MSCPHRKNCRLEQRLSVTLDVWRKAYCDSERHENCARFKLAAEGMAIPIALLPNGLRMASKR